MSEGLEVCNHLKTKSKFTTCRLVHYTWEKTGHRCCHCFNVELHPIFAIDCQIVSIHVSS